MQSRATAARSASAATMTASRARSRPAPHRRARARSRPGRPCCRVARPDRGLRPRPDPAAPHRRRRRHRCGRAGALEPAAAALAIVVGQLGARRPASCSALRPGSPIPTPGNVDTLRDRLSRRARDVAQYAAPVPARRPPVHPLLLIGGGAGLPAAVDLFAVHPAPGAAGRPAAADDLQPSGRRHRRPVRQWWLFAVIAGRSSPCSSSRTATRSRAGVARPTAKGLASRSAPARSATRRWRSARRHRARGRRTAAVPTMSISVFEGNGPGTREVSIADPMVDLRRDLGRGEDIPLLGSRTPPTRTVVPPHLGAHRFSDSQWTPGDREVPAAQAADGSLPRPTGCPRRAAAASSTTTSRRRPGLRLDVAAHPGARRPDRRPATTGATTLDTLDFLAARDNSTTANSTYDFTVSSSATTPTGWTPRCPARGSVARDVHRAAERPSTTDPPARSEHHRRRAHALREGGGAAAVVPRGRRLPLRPQRRAAAGNGSARPGRVPHTSRASGYCEQFAAAMAVMAPQRSASRPGSPSASSSPTRSRPTPTSTARTTCTPGPSCTSPAPAGCASSPPRPVRAPASRRTTPTAQSADVTETPTPSAARPSEDLPERGTDAAADAATDDSSSSSSPGCRSSPACSACARGPPAADAATGPHVAAPAPPRRRRRGRSGSSCATWPST